MGKTKRKNGDGHIVFHVGKELPTEGDNILLVPGIQNAQGRGVYFSDIPQLKYSGGEHFQKTMEITPIYCVPLVGTWQKGVLKRKDNAVVYHTKGRVVALKDLHYEDIVQPNGEITRYYVPTEVSFFHEPSELSFSEKVREGKLSFNESIERLRDLPNEHVDRETIQREIRLSIEQGMLPEALGEVMDKQEESTSEFHMGMR